MIDEKSENLARILEKNDSYRVIRKFESKNIYNLKDNIDSPLIGVYLDIETTGLNVSTDKIIELGMVQFEFHPDGRIFEILSTFNSFEDPGRLIPDEVSKLTGITNEMVSGHEIDRNMVRDLIEPASVVVAHNASFDRKFAELLEPEFEKKAWACSMNDIDWYAQGIEGVKLEYIAYRLGFFYDGHRASYDCLAGIHVLSHELPINNEFALKSMLDKARVKNYRIWALGSPFEMKDVLRARGYKWNPGENNNPKSWYIDISNDKAKLEMEFLQDKIYGNAIDLRYDIITAFNRYSNRL